MSEVETTEAVESSSDTEEPVEGAEEQTTTPVEEPVSTWKARVAGKDRALTQTKAELAQAQKLAAELSAWKAEREKADMSEVDRLNLQIQELQSEKAAAVAAAEFAARKAEFPLSFALLGEGMPSDPGTLATLEARLAEGAAAAEPAPRVDPNNPRRSVQGIGKSIKDKTDAELLADLASYGNPFNADVIAGNT